MILPLEAWAFCLLFVTDEPTPTPSEGVKNSPPGSGGELEGEPLITVHGLQGVVDRGNACPSWVYGRTLPPPKLLRASTPPKIGGDFFTPSLQRRGMQTVPV